MSEARGNDQDEIASASQSASPFDFHTAMISLQAAGAELFDPVCWRYVTSLAKQAAAHDGCTKRLLDDKLVQALKAFEKRLERARSDARESLAMAIEQYPHANEDLQRLFDIGDFNELRRLVARLKSDEQGAGLGALVRRLNQHIGESAENVESTEARLDEHSGLRPELKTIRRFKDTWSKLSVDKQLVRALEQAPKNAGPINSHMLVLRSLTLMRDISPEYLNRFVSYAETLLCLDQGEKEKASMPQKSRAAKRVKR